MCVNMWVIAFDSVGMRRVIIMKEPMDIKNFRDDTL